MSIKHSKTIQKIGIALAAYQPEPQSFLEQLTSIQNQTFKNWVCIIQFDSEVKPYQSDSHFEAIFKDPRFIWRQNERRLGHLRNFEKAMQGLLEFEVDAIACSDQDDLWYSHKLETCAIRLQGCSPLSLVHCDMHVSYADKTLSETAWIVEKRGIRFCKPRHLLIRNIVAGCSMLLDTELVRKFPHIPDSAGYHDHWYALAASYHGGVHAIHEPLFTYRQHAQNEVGVTTFLGRFKLPKKMGVIEILEKCWKGWLKTKNFTHAAIEYHLPLKRWEKWVFYLPWDLGIGIFSMGCFHFFSDPALSRACFARTIGKFVQLGFKKLERE